MKTCEVLKSLIDYKSSFFADPTPWIEPPVPSMWVYAMATSSSLLVVYLAVLVAMRIDFRARLARLCGGWERMPQNETLILHTLPYYLAITRSSCEVTSRQSSQLEFTVLNSGLYLQHSHWAEHHQHCKRCRDAWRLLVETL